MPHFIQVNPKESEIDGEYFHKLFNVDNNHGTEKWCPDITEDHLDSNNMLKMPVILLAQVIIYLHVKAIVYFNITLIREFSKAVRQRLSSVRG